MINPSQLKTLIIEPTLKNIGLHSPDAVALLLGTAAQESACGTYLKQLGNARARGIFQCEPATFNDVVHNFLVHKPDLMQKVAQEAYPPLKILDVKVTAKIFDPEQLIFNLRLATAIARLHYLRIPIALPKKADISGQAKTWKKYYNSIYGKGTEEEYVSNYLRYGLDKL